MKSTATPRDLATAGETLRRGEVTSVELTEACLARDDADQRRLGVFMRRFESEAADAARLADKELADGIDRGPLHGIPIGIKDNIATREAPATAQSAAFDPHWYEGRDATSVTRLRDAGAVILGKLTLGELGVGGFDGREDFPRPRNPWDVNRGPGGSSAGAGAGLAAGLVYGAIGTDTGGSVRIPAAYCGVTGFKPTFGVVDIAGTIPLSESLDHVGPMARSVRDCAALFDVIAGRPASQSMQRRSPSTVELRGLRVGAVPVEALPDDTAPAVARRYRESLAVLGDLGAELREVTIPHEAEAMAAFVVIEAAEALAMHHTRLRERWHDHTAGVRRWTARGALVSAADLVIAQRAAARIAVAATQLFADVDVIVSPTTTTTAPRLDTPPAGGAAAVLRTLLTHYWNLTGCPALAMPIGPADDGMPLSLQVVGRRHDDVRVLEVGTAFQQVTDWHQRAPANPAREEPS